MMDMKFTLKPNGEVVLEWEKNGEKKRVEIDHAIAKVDIENINPTPGGIRVMLELSVSEIDVQYDSDRSGDYSTREIKQQYGNET